MSGASPVPAWARAVRSPAYDCPKCGGRTRSLTPPRECGFDDCDGKPEPVNHPKWTDTPPTGDA